MTVYYDYDRAEWLAVGVPPITGPVWDGSKIRYFNIHYTGASSSYAGKSEQAALNAIQKDYQNNRGYSFGYSSAVGLSGNTYEGRGTTYRAASNGMDVSHGDDLEPGDPRIKDNLEVFSCLLITGVPDNPTTQMIAGIRRLYESISAHMGRPLIINGHRDMDQTACPGDRAYALIKNGTFYPREEDKDDMQTLRTPRRIIDTRESGSPVSGSRTFDLKSNAATLVDAEITVTSIPVSAMAGFAGLTNKDSFCNWLAGDVNRPIPQTLSVPVNNKAVTLFFSSLCHVIIDVRAEG